MRVCRNFGIAWVIACLLFSSNVYAQALPAFTGRVNTAIAGLVKAKAVRWGFAANDPRIAATFTGVSSGLTTIAIGVATGSVAVIGWPALLVAAGVTVLVAGAISLGSESLYKWLFNPDGMVTTTSPGKPGIPYENYVWHDGINSVQDGYPSQIVLGQDCLPLKAGGGSNGVLGNYSLPFKYWCGNRNAIPPLPNELREMTADMLNGSPTASVSVVASPEKSAAAIPDDELAKPISNEMLAAAANAAWKVADMSSGGLPWSASDPITPEEVATWKHENPQSVPTVADLVAPAANGNTVPVSPRVPVDGSPSPFPGPEPTPGKGTQVDLGPNPNVPAPLLEATPTAIAILGPLFELMPDLKEFEVPSHESTCPKPSFMALGSTYKLESQCILIEQNRSLIEASMMLVWLLGSMFIILRA